MACAGRHDARRRDAPWYGGSPAVLRRRLPVPRTGSRPITPLGTDVPGSARQLLPPGRPPTLVLASFTNWRGITLVLPRGQSRALSRERARIPRNRAAHARIRGRADGSGIRRLPLRRGRAPAMGVRQPGPAGDPVRQSHDPPPDAGATARGGPDVARRAALEGGRGGSGDRCDRGGEATRRELDRIAPQAGGTGRRHAGVGCVVARGDASTPGGNGDLLLRSG